MAKSQLGAHVEIESIFPSDFRRIVGRYTREDVATITRLRDQHRKQRDTFAWFLATKAIDGAPSLTWLLDDLRANATITRDVVKETSPAFALVAKKYAANPDEIPFAIRMAVSLVFKIIGHESFLESRMGHRLWSLAQHYGVPTAIVDVTSAPGVAAWFATHHWCPPPDVADIGTGVVYRFDAERLEESFNTYERNNFFEFLLEKRLPPFRPFLTDISDIPEATALRPSRQCGASIAGLDQPTILKHAEDTGAIECFLFQHDGVGFQTQTWSRDLLMPKSDPFAELETEYRRGVLDGTIVETLGDVNQRITNIEPDDAKVQPGRLVSVAPSQRWLEWTGWASTSTPDSFHPSLDAVQHRALKAEATAILLSTSVFLAKGEAELQTALARITSAHGI